MQRDCKPSDFLKAAIKIDARPLVRIAKDAGVDRAILSRFVNGKRGISSSTFDRVCGVMDLGLHTRRRSA
jgi:plasmid maintenance system antidote protein VapI